MALAGRLGFEPFDPLALSLTVAGRAGGNVQPTTVGAIPGQFHMPAIRIDDT